MVGDSFKILALGGDGVGPEVVAAALKVLDRLAKREGIRLEITEDLLHGAAYDRYGTFCRDETLAAARAADGVLVGAVGGAKWDKLFPEGTPAERDGLMRLRQELDLFAGLRPARAYDALLDRTPYRRELVAGADVLVLRELCGGMMFAHPRGTERLADGGLRAFETNLYSSGEIERVARVGFELARRRKGALLSIDKANVLESGALWRRLVGEIGARDYPDVALTHYYADNALYQLARRPRDFDVILAENLLGDLISDLAATLAGSLGMLPSACLARLAPEGEASTPGVYEPVHGTAPDIAGAGIANPIGCILSAAMLCRYGLARPDLAERIERAVERCLARDILTPDLGGLATTQEVTDSVIGGLD